MTLVEVLGSLAILGTVLVALVLAKGRLRDQDARAAAKLRAVSAAEGLLHGWWLDPQGIPRSGEGRVPGYEDLTWRTTAVPREPIEDLGLSVVEVRILGADRPVPAPEAAPGSRSAPDAWSPEALVSLELVLPGRGAGRDER